MPKWLWLKELWPPHDFVATRQPQEFPLWPQDSYYHASVWAREGRGKGTQTLRFSCTPKFHVHYKSVWAWWMLRCSKLTLRVSEAVSAVCGITFHPNGMDRGLTTVTLTLLHYTNLRLPGLWGRVGLDYQHSPSILSLHKHSLLPVAYVIGDDRLKTGHALYRKDIHHMPTFFKNNIRRNYFITELLN